MSHSNAPLNCFANIVVISMIPTIFFVSMLLGYINIIPINIPIHALLIVGFILFIFFLFIKHNANYSICKMHASYSKMENKLKTALDENSLHLNQTNKSILDIDEFLKHHYADIRNDNFVSVASSVFPMLGILGTFTAIAISMPNFSVTDTKALDGEISLLLSGIGSAFFASIFGILLSLIWTYFEKRGLSKIDKFFYTVKDDFKPYIWSKNELNIYKFEQYKPKDEKFITALKETFNLDFIEKLNVQHQNSYKAIMDDTNSSFKLLSKHLEHISNELKESLSQIDNAKNSIDAREQIENTISDFTLATQSFEKTVKIHSAQLDTSLNRTFEKIDTEIGDIVIKLADFATHVSLESKEVQDSIGKYHFMISKQLRVK